MSDVGFIKMAVLRQGEKSYISGSTYLGTFIYVYIYRSTVLITRQFEIGKLCEPSI